MREKEVPGRRHTDVVVTVVIPVVVDVEPVVVEVADVDTVAVRVQICPLSSMAPKVEIYCSKNLYPLPSEFYLGADSKSSPLKVSKKFNLFFIRTLS